MSTRSRARPWFAVADRLERYSVRVDELDEAGGLHSLRGLLWANDFDFERAAPDCPHRYISGVVRRNRDGSADRVRPHCRDCGTDLTEPSKLPVPRGRTFGDFVRMVADQSVASLPHVQEWINAVEARDGLFDEAVRVGRQAGIDLLVYGTSAVHVDARTGRVTNLNPTQLVIDEAAPVDYHQIAFLSGRRLGKTDRMLAAVEDLLAPPKATAQELMTVDLVEWNRYQKHPPKPSRVPQQLQRKPWDRRR